MHEHKHMFSTKGRVGVVLYVCNNVVTDSSPLPLQQAPDTQAPHTPPHLTPPHPIPDAQAPHTPSRPSPCRGHRRRCREVGAWGGGGGVSIMAIFPYWI